jgi:hypothetical protein
MKTNAITNKSFLKSFVSKLLLITILASCTKKDNSLTTETKAASTITNGVASVGPAGPHNNLVYYGTTDPDPSVGCLGDYYLDVNKGILYGPKVTNGWGTFLTLSGATAAENKIFSGPNLPESNLGTTGDYYVNITNFLFYGPKASAGWGNPVDLQHQGK